MQKNTSIHIVENFISKSTCDFLIKTYKEEFKELPNKNFWGGPSIGLEKGWEVKPGNAFPKYENDDQKNIAADLITNICWSISRELSEQFLDPVDMRTFFFSKMTTGAMLNEHYDNYDNDGAEFYFYGSDPEIIKKIGFQSDYSALLYLNNSYDGGEIEFMQHGIKIKPSPGTLIFFKGDMNAFHKVNEVTNGERYNFVTFYWSTEYRKKYFKELKSKSSGLGTE